MSVPLVPGIKKYDKALNQVDPHKNNLLIQFSKTGFTCVIFNQDTNKFLSLETINFDTKTKTEKIPGQLKDYFLDHIWFKQSFHSVKFLFETNKSTLVPAPLFDKNEKLSFCNFNFQCKEDETILYNYLRNLDAYILYSVSSNLIETIDHLYPVQSYFSHAGALIESLLILNKNQKKNKRFFVNVRDSYLDIIILEGRKLLYFNTFNYYSKDDFIYFVVFVLEQLQLNPEEIDLVLSGMIDKNSKIFEAIHKYIRNISFQARTDTFSYSYVFNEVSLHHYSNLIHFELCEL